MRFLQVLCGVVFVLAVLGLIFAMAGNAMYWQDLGDGVCDTCRYGPINNRQEIAIAAGISLAIYGIPAALAAWGYVSAGRAARNRKQSKSSSPTV